MLSDIKLCENLNVILNSNEKNYLKICHANGGDFLHYGIEQICKKHSLNYEDVLFYFIHSVMN